MLEVRTLKSSNKSVKSDGRDEIEKLAPFYFAIAM